MEAEAVAGLPPAGPDWQYEPKVGGFRSLFFRDGYEVHLQSRNQKPLGRYFPEIARAVLSRPRSVFLDEELVNPVTHSMPSGRLHPEGTRIKELSRQTPARFVAFDLLALAKRKTNLLLREFRRLHQQDPPASGEKNLARKLSFWVD
jgi:ATP-dependent DNA ligase